MQGRVVFPSVAAAVAIALAVLAPPPPPAAAQGAPAAAAPAPLPSVTLPAELDRVLRDYERAWQARDAAGLAALFAEDGFVLGNGRPPASGRAAIREAYTGAGGPLSLRALAYAAQDSVGYIIGAFVSAAGSPDQGKFVLALRRPNGRGPWLIAADIDNTNQRRGPGGGGGPPPGAQPAQPQQRPPGDVRDTEPRR